MKNLLTTLVLATLFLNNGGLLQNAYAHDNPSTVAEDALDLNLEVKGIQRIANHTETVHRESMGLRNTLYPATDFTSSSLALQGNTSTAYGVISAKISTEIEQEGAQTKTPLGMSYVQWESLSRDTTWAPYQLTLGRLHPLTTLRVFNDNQSLLLHEEAFAHTHWHENGLRAAWKMKAHHLTLGAYQANFFPSVDSNTVIPVMEYQYQTPSITWLGHITHIGNTYEMLNTGNVHTHQSLDTSLCGIKISCKSAHQTLAQVGVKHLTDTMQWMSSIGYMQRQGAMQDMITRLTWDQTLYFARIEALYLLPNAWSIGGRAEYAYSTAHLEGFGASAFQQRQGLVSESPNPTRIAFGIHKMLSPALQIHSVVNYDEQRLHTVSGQLGLTYKWQHHLIP